MHMKLTFIIAFILAVREPINNVNNVLASVHFILLSTVSGRIRRNVNTTVTHICLHIFCDECVHSCYVTTTDSSTVPANVNHHCASGGTVLPAAICLEVSSTSLCAGYKPSLDVG